MVRQTNIIEEEELDPELFGKLSQDLVLAARRLARREVRYIVDSYYQQQELRKAIASQIRSMRDDGEPVLFLTHLLHQAQTAEAHIKRAMDAWTSEEPVSVWARSNVGVGPVLAAGLMAHIDFGMARTAGQIWRFAGLDPTVTWKKGEKRPWNATLKTICWRLGDSFVKQSNKPACFYGQVYRERKLAEVKWNEEGANKLEARRTLETRTFNDKATKSWYEKGMLPPGRLDLRARRVAVKLFLSHLHQVWWETYRDGAPAPYSVAHLEHAHYSPPPNWEGKPSS